MPKDSKNFCLEDMRQRILSLDLEPGSDLDEIGLTQHYGLSRTPLREILQRLAGEGYIQLNPNRGAKVASMDLARMQVFFRTAPMIYANIAYMAAEMRTQAQLEGLKFIQAEFVKATENGQSHDAAFSNFRFHEMIGRMAHNPYLMACMDRLLIDHTRLSKTFYDPREEDEQDLVQTAAEQHEGIIAAIEARDPNMAMDISLQHWDLSRDRIERFVRPDPLPAQLSDIEERRHAV